MYMVMWIDNVLYNCHISVLNIQSQIIKGKN